ncbi:MAG TPA: FKBP-type peptidyl-prolyl cis-trans isomerase [Gemmatimonadaceae bacterium]|nr:FKBP-type peptidyl-prolyl cis-trans isomerase [Gemmatimonadaceae bacterium]
MIAPVFRARVVMSALILAATACASGPAAVTTLTNASITPSLGVDLATYVHTPDGLYYKDVATGDGKLAERASRVTVAYRMLLTNGTQVDSSAGLTIRLQGGDPIIKGWRLGIPGMRVGGSRILIIPPELGYEWREVGKIPPNSTLLFRVQLLAVQ